MNYKEFKGAEMRFSNFLEFQMGVKLQIAPGHTTPLNELL